MNNLFLVRIPRPHPGTDENKRQIEFIEPLRAQDKVFVSRAYMFNLEQFTQGKECSLSPGFKYDFGFVNEEDSVEFQKMFGGAKINE
jgi:hypothetical protein